MLKKVKNSVRESIYKNFRNSSKNHAEYHTLKQAITEVSETICEKKIIISQKTFRPHNYFHTNLDFIHKRLKRCL